jgi:hypothetical protein
VKAVSFIVKRDFFALAFLVLAFLDGLALLLWLIAITSNVLWIVVLKKLVAPRRAPVLASTD